VRSCCTWRRGAEAATQLPFGCGVWHTAQGCGSVVRQRKVSKIEQEHGRVCLLMQVENGVTIICYI
jgi:hypothetical protein